MTPIDRSGHSFKQHFAVILTPEVGTQIRNVEILKKRFGDSDFEVCEVMLKDIADSKRIDTNVHSLAAAVCLLSVPSIVFLRQLLTEPHTSHGHLQTLLASATNERTQGVRPDGRVSCWLSR